MSASDTTVSGEVSVQNIAYLQLLACFNSGDHNLKPLITVPEAVILLCFIWVMRVSVLLPMFEPFKPELQSSITETPPSVSAGFHKVLKYCYNYLKIIFYRSQVMAFSCRVTALDQSMKVTLVVATPAVSR